MRPLLALTLILAATSSAAETCTIAVDGRVWLDGPCTFSADTDGSFTAAAPDGSVFAAVLVAAPGVAEGYWNEGQGSHAHTPLGTLTRDGACWVGAGGATRVCAMR